MNIVAELVVETREFARHRDLFQHHTPKNLAMAIASEARELAGDFRCFEARAGDWLLGFSTGGQTAGSGCEEFRVAALGH